MPVKHLRRNDWPRVPPPGQSAPATLRPQETAHGKPRLAAIAAGSSLPGFPLAVCLAWYAPIGQWRSGSPHPPAPRVDKAEGEGRGRSSRFGGSGEGRGLRPAAGSGARGRSAGAGAVLFCDRSPRRHEVGVGAGSGVHAALGR